MQDLADTDQKAFIGKIIAALDGSEAAPPRAAEEEAFGAFVHGIRNEFLS